MNKLFSWISLLLLLTFLNSCGSYTNIPYFKDLNRLTPTEEQVSNYSPFTIQIADVLGINVSSRNPESSSIFNRANGNNDDSPQNSSQNPSMAGYLVDQKGEIHLPLLGSLKVSGLTTSALRDTLNKMLITYYKDPVTNVRILNIKVAVYGDVLHPNVYNLQNERTTITQALSLAGDLNITALRNIILIRELDGKRSYIPIDLNSKKLFESPYFYLKNNDEIYVQPDRTKYATVDRGYRTATLVLSGLSIIAIVLSNLFR
ncbi:polysaccharide export outer membrane protein [Dyadobacter koreensis]|uniref:Polysaccharide export outer membrane protein n=1 Tax=Dyadobacter koreensis TaxID=408657 RepID=A0A1H6QNE7_9BACT|nr:polysaccharide biosynthesis/export family protein [Dyadobacter koreensis]SEI40542.1 polysaccharide export outer membrane protein [Dyadobacter koreensis]